MKRRIVFLAVIITGLVVIGAKFMLHPTWEENFSKSAVELSKTPREASPQPILSLLEDQKQFPPWVKNHLGRGNWKAVESRTNLMGWKCTSMGIDGLCAVYRSAELGPVFLVGMPWPKKQSDLATFNEGEWKVQFRWKWRMAWALVVPAHSSREAIDRSWPPFIQ